MYIFHRFLLFIALMIGCNIAYGQYIIPDEKLIDYSAEDLSLRDVLNELGETAEVTIAFQEEIIPGDSIVNLSVRRERLGKVIDYLIEPHGLKYKIIGNQIVILKDKFKKADDKITISGYLKDQDSGEGLVNAYVYLFDESEGTYTNEYGFYSFTIDKGVRRVYYSYLGYDLGIHEFALAKDTTIDIALKADNRLSEIIITEQKIKPEIDFPEVASFDVLPIDKINSTVSLGGEPDVLRMAYAEPGITTGADGFGGMSVRGGATNQNLILYDGIPVYNANHAFGLFSIFNSNVIKSAKLYKGAFPSHYSGRLSSVMDIRTREGNNQKLSGDFSVGLLTVKGSLEGPIKKDKSLFLISARRTFVDPWIKTLTEYLNEREGKMGHTDAYFLDLNAKLNFSLGQNSKVYFSYYTGEDNFENNTLEPVEENNKSREIIDQTAWDSKNTLASLRWNLRMSHKAFLNVSSYYSKYTFGSFEYDRVNELEAGQQVNQFYTAGYYQSQIIDKGIKFELDYIPNIKHRFKIGGGYIEHDFTPGLILADNFDNLTSGEEDLTANQLSGLIDEPDLLGKEYEFYIEDNIRINKYTHLNLGYNQMVVNTGKTFFIPQPRILFSTGSKKYNLKMSWGRMGQYLHNLTNTGLGIPVDVWLPSTDKLQPETSWIASMGHFLTGDKLGRVDWSYITKD